MKETVEKLFLAICFGFSALLLVLSLLCSIRLAAENDRVLRLQREAETLREENAALLARYESSVSLEQIEQYARRVLGMQSCSAEQVVYIPMD